MASFFKYIVVCKLALICVFALTITDAFVKINVVKERRSQKSFATNLMMNSKNAPFFKVAILGASGYTGSELMRLLVQHQHVQVNVLTADRSAGQGM